MEEEFTIGQQLVHHPFGDYYQYNVYDSDMNMKGTFSSEQNALAAIGCEG